jgi:hypothetical protein
MLLRRGARINGRDFDYNSEALEVTERTEVSTRRNGVTEVSTLVRLRLADDVSPNDGAMSKRE